MADPLIRNMARDTQELLRYQRSERAELLRRIDALGERCQEMYRKGYEAGYTTGRKRGLVLATNQEEPNDG